MTRRAEGVDATRQKIVAAAKELHEDGGVIATSFEAIAARAGVAQGTVYRHFPSLDELIPACARTIHVLRPIDPERASDAVPRCHIPLNGSNGSSAEPANATNGTAVGSTRRDARKTLCQRSARSGESSVRVSGCWCGRPSRIPR